MAIFWRDRATRDLAGIFDYVAADNPSAAADVVRRLQTAIAGLVQFPRRGRKGAFPGTLELMIPGFPYVVAYRLPGDDIEILAVPHAAQRR
jgi:plasmid stabilization system protein ParE